RSGTGADLSVHDNEHGIVVVRADRGTQYVQANVTDGGEATYEGDSRVVVTTEDDRDASFTVVGNGSVGVNDDGNVVAELGTEGVLVVRAYHAKRSTEDKRREAFIADGIATAEVYVMERPSGTVVDTIPYENDTSVNVTATNDSVNMTVDRSQRQGAIVFASVNGSVSTASGTLGVFVDGEAIPSANTFAQLGAAANNGQESRYMTTPGGESEAVTDVAIAINHFSPREVSVRSVENASNGTATTTSTATTAA
ncbi:PGF-CTERM sorting domain-containing protein, partial [Halobium palmae]